MAKLLIPISNGFEEIETVSIIDICRRANIEVTIASIENIEVKGAHQISIKADTLLCDIEGKDFDMIALPGGLPNAFNLAEDELLQKTLKKFKENNKNIAAICAAPYALFEAGVLNKNYTCYPGFEGKINGHNYIQNQDVVIDNKVLTSRGPATAMTFALEIVKILKGQEKYEIVKEAILAKNC
ncbi:MAG: DJ-1 family glyoxalase III [Arcobacter sp.]|uniref:DJ-1 family glyoxalase III n=1 Tax=Arcobacter sp. TaxID=1872629 RepID=UPI003B0040A4